MSSMTAPLFLASTAISAAAQARAGRAEQRMYDAKAADALMKGRSEAIAYKQQGADVLSRLNDNLAAIIARSASGGVVPESGSSYTTALFGQAEAAKEYHTALDNAVMAEGQAQIQAEQYTLAGEEAKRTGRMNAFSTISSGLFKFGQL